MIARKCLNCGADFKTKPSELKRGKGKFCSRKCNTTVRNCSKETPIDFVVSHSQPVTECGCWICNGSPQTNGYGRFRYQGKNVAAHRFSWSAFNASDVPIGLVVMHKCDTPMCVNPAHLRIGTQKENMVDRDRKGRRRIGVITRMRTSREVVISVKRDAGTLREIAARHHLSVGCVHNIRSNRIKAYEGIL